jgi:hypothetical protein
MTDAEAAQRCCHTHGLVGNCKWVCTAVHSSHCSTRLHKLLYQQHKACVPSVVRGCDVAHSKEVLPCCAGWRLPMPCAHLGHCMHKPALTRWHRAHCYYYRVLAAWGCWLHTQCALCRCHFATVALAAGAAIVCCCCSSC